jgi:N-acetylglucosaminyl-diphospho-decaprenol L-rhamnosyltransferase
MRRTLIVIVNYRSGELTRDCLHSLALENPEASSFEVVVVDNGSADSSVELLRSEIAKCAWGGWVSVLDRGVNDGFAAGNNAAIEPALAAAEPPREILLLNPDTVVRPRFLEPLRAFLRDHPDIGIVGSRLEDPDGAPQRSAFRFPGAMSELERGMKLGLASRFLKQYLVAPPVRDEAHACDWVAGASMLVRREVFASVGALDPGYFLYFEEVEFCRRARRGGWRTWYVPESRVVHLVGQSSGLDGNRPRQKPMPAYWFASRRRYLERGHGWAYARLADLGWLIGHLSWRVRRVLQRRANDEPSNILGDFIAHNFLTRRAAP